MSGAGSQEETEIPFSPRDLSHLDSWLCENVPTVEPPVEVTWLSGGHSNLTFLLRDSAGSELVLRRPPLGMVLHSAHDVLREFRFIDALASTRVPVADPIGRCADPEVIGAPFYLMGYVEGVVLESVVDASVYPFEARSRVASHAVGVLHGLHEVEPGEVGLGDLARPGSFLERQIRRWRKQIDQPTIVSGTLLIEAKDILVDSIPPERWHGIVHGDFRLGNMIVASDGTLLALLDWELAAIGDTLVDVGWMISSWAEAGEPSTSPFVPPTTAGGFPTRDEMIALYATATGRDLSDLPYYVAFSHWRAACIGEGLAARYRSKVMGRVDFDVGQYERSILETAELALYLLRQL